MCMVVLSRPMSLLLSPVSRNSGASAMILHARLAAENVELATDAHTHTHTQSTRGIGTATDNGTDRCRRATELYADALPPPHQTAEHHIDQNARQ